MANPLSLRLPDNLRQLMQIEADRHSQSLSAAIIAACWQSLEYPPEIPPIAQPAIMHPPIADRAATMANLRQVVAGIESADTTPIEPTPIEMCSYEEWSSELGEMVRCRLAMHAPKVKHKL